MTAIKITNFAGEIPRMSPRALPVDAAQVNSNLLATSTEFRPLADDSVTGPAVAESKTLYRLSRKADGSLRTDPAEGWLTNADDMSYVKGQINDDATERTYLTFNDGTRKPRVIDALGADRLLGVPPPLSVTTVLEAVAQFTREDANLWVAGSLVPDLIKILRDEVGPLDDNTWRFRGATPIAGPSQFYGMTPEPGSLWNLMYTTDDARAQKLGLKDQQLGGTQEGGVWTIRITALPFWGQVWNMASLKAKLRMLLSPKDGSQMLTEPMIESWAAAFADYIDPNGSALKARRTSLDDAVKGFKTAIESADIPSPERPIPPVRPTEPEYIYTEDSNPGGSA